MTAVEYMGKVRVGTRGHVTIPARLRTKLGMGGGAVLCVYEMGGGILLMAGESWLEHLSRKVQEVAAREGVTLEDMLAALAEDRRGDAEPPRVAAQRAIEADALPPEWGGSAREDD